MKLNKNQAKAFNLKSKTAWNKRRELSKTVKGGERIRGRGKERNNRPGTTHSGRLPLLIAFYFMLFLHQAQRRSYGSERWLCL